ncbi:hypothetical protein [Paenibacillus lautus]|jgi:hypothetical protein|uniref:hypothetical protein n=1 Tax=Paenibacillus lautus TaxID=1401 RepID=UPI00398599D7
MGAKKNSRTTQPLPETNLPTRVLIATAFRRLSPDNLKVIPYTGLTLFFLVQNVETGLAFNILPTSVNPATI